jgi:CheY-like chemotaxis protein
VITAADGEEGPRLAQERKPDLVVLDMLLPILSGPEVLRALRKDPDTASIPVMVLTSLPQTNEKKLIGEGATSYYAKSELMVDKGPSLFMEAVEKMLAKAKAAGCWTLKVFQMAEGPAPEVAFVDQRRKEVKDEDMDGNYQHGQTGRPCVWRREKGGSKADAHQRQRVCSLATAWEPHWGRLVAIAI